MTDRTRIVWGRVVASVAVTGAVGGLLWMVALGFVEQLWTDYLVQNAVVAIGFGAMVWMVIPSQPRNRVVWISALAAVSAGTTVFLTAAFYQAITTLGISSSIWTVSPVELPTWLAAIGIGFNSLWLGILLVPTLVVLHLPDGDLPSPGWRWVTRAGWAAWAVGVAGFAWASRPSATDTYQAIQQVDPSAPGVARTVAAIGFLGLGVLIPVCVGGMVARYWRSRGVERQQLRWVAWGASVAGPVLVAAIVVETAGDVGLALALLTVGLVVLVGSLAVAIGKYRLYDVDVVINRTVVFAVLAGFIALVYATVVTGVGSRIGAAGEGWAPILATAAVALAFEPVRHVAQRWANRLAYGHRASPYEVLADLTGRLTGSAEPDRLLDRMAELVVDGTGAERATIWLGEPGGMRPVASKGAGTSPSADLDLSADTVFTVEHDGETVGAIEVVAPRGGRLSTQERALLRDLAGSAGAVLGYQRLNESLAGKARELDLSRRRLVDAEDQELRRLERELDEGAQQQVLAIKVNLALAERAAAEQGAERLAALLAGLADEAQGALDEVRRLSKGIYPPVLQSDGLGPALSALAAGAPVPVEVHGDGVGRYPPDVEAAVYFDVAEALTNAVKHATPPIRIEVGEHDGLLAFAVSDTGPGFDPATVAAGSGLANLRDRVEAVGGRVWVTSAPGSGTTVAGEVPLDREPVAG